MLRGVKQQAAEAQDVCGPKLKTRSINIVKAYETAFLPTKAMFSVFWNVVGERIKVHWQDGDWWQYFASTYLAQTPVDAASFGVEMLTTARWWRGAGLGFGVGHGPTMQPREQFNRKLKRDVASLTDDLSTHSAVIRSLKEAAMAWSQSPAQPLVNALLATRGDLLPERPNSPDAWMLGRE